MWTDNPDGEPVVCLETGQVVLQGVFDTVCTLQTRGITVAINGAGEISVTPSRGVHPDTVYLLESNWSDVQAVLDAGTAWPTIH